MARTIEFLVDRLAVRLGGVTRVAAMTGDFEIAYSAIRSVSAGPFPGEPWKVAGLSESDVESLHLQPEVG